jgi:hypothetical protein
LKRGREACQALLLNKDKLEQAVLDEIQTHFLSEENVRKSNARAGSKSNPSKVPRKKPWNSPYKLLKRRSDAGKRP